MRKAVTKKEEKKFETSKTGKIACRFAEYVLVPHNAIEASFFRGGIVDKNFFKTMNDKTCLGTFVATWNNEDGRYDDELQQLCRTMFKSSLSAIRSNMLSRLGNVEERWHLIKLSEV